MNVTTPLDTDLDQTKLGTKVGKSEAQLVLGLVAWGDAGTQEAAKNGNITVLRGADQEQLSILGLLYVRYRTVVYGD
ncbi:MAG TPA: TRL domain-containing protein [Myxococcota bacterium]|nr:TRL domain-containing protein [Myxococcota bacterium]